MVSVEKEVVRASTFSNLIQLNCWLLQKEVSIRLEFVSNDLKVQCLEELTKRFQLSFHPRVGILSQNLQQKTNKKERWERTETQACGLDQP